MGPADLTNGAASPTNLADLADPAAPERATSAAPAAGDIQATSVPVTEPVARRTTDAASPNGAAGSAGPAVSAPPAASGGGAAEDRVASRQRYRLRDLDRPGRWAAVVLAAALLVAPLLAFLQLAPDWVPANDPAVMAMRALDVGGPHTPLLGQPTTARNQLGEVASEILGSGPDHDVYCLGPLQFYMLAPAVRLLGAATGMLVVSVLINGTALLLTAWAVFRQLGRGGGLLAVAILGTITFTTGASSLVNPLNSMVVAYPLVLAVVLSWCLLGGDRRLLPLTVGVVTFTAQQHLSIVPLLGAAFLTGLAGAVWPVVDRVRHGRWRDDGERRELRRWGALAAGVGAVLWAPTVVQQLTHEPGNLGQLWLFTRADARDAVGLRRGIDQVAHVLGLPPVLGQRRFGGPWLLGEVAIGTWLSVAVVVMAFAVLAVVWSRPGPRRDLVRMTGVLAVAAVANASQVPAGAAALRTDLTHWTWPLVLFVTLGLALGAADLLRPRRAAHPVTATTRDRPMATTAGTACGATAADPGASEGRGLRRLLTTTRERARRRPGRRFATAVAAVVAVVVGPAVVNPSLDRPTNREQDANSPIERRFIDRAADAVVAHTDGLDEPMVVLVRGQAAEFDGLDGALALALEERGHPATLNAMLARNVNPSRVVDPDTVETGLVLVLDGGQPVERPPGELVADIRTDDDFDYAAYDELLAAVEASGGVRPGPEMQRMLAESPGDKARLIAYGLTRFRADAAQQLRNPAVVRFLLDFPLAEPQLEPALLRRLLAGLDDDHAVTRLQVYRLDRAQLLDFAVPWELEGLPANLG